MPVPPRSQICFSPLVLLLLPQPWLNFLWFFLTPAWKQSRQILVSSCVLHESVESQGHCSHHIHRVVYMWTCGGLRLRSWVARGAPSYKIPHRHPGPCTCLRKRMHRLTHVQVVSPRLSRAEFSAFSCHPATLGCDSQRVLSAVLVLAN